MPDVPCLWKHPFPILRALKYCWKVGQKWSKGQGLSYFVSPPGSGRKRWWPCRLCPCCQSWLGWVPGINPNSASRCRENLLWFLIQGNNDSRWTQNNRPFGKRKELRKKHLENPLSLTVWQERQGWAGASQDSPHGVCQARAQNGRDELSSSFPTMIPRARQFISELLSSGTN